MAKSVSITIKFPGGEHSVDNYQIELVNVDVMQLLLASWALHKEIDKNVDMLSKRGPGSGIVVPDLSLGRS